MYNPCIVNITCTPRNKPTHTNHFEIVIASFSHRGKMTLLLKSPPITQKLYGSAPNLSLHWLSQARELDLFCEIMLIAQAMECPLPRTNFCFRLNDTISRYYFNELSKLFAKLFMKIQDFTNVTKMENKKPHRKSDDKL